MLVRWVWGWVSVLVLVKFENNSKNLLEGGVYDVLRINILKL